MEKQIEINGVSYPLHFGFKALKFLSEQWSCKGPVGVKAKMINILFPDGLPDGADNTEMGLNDIDFPFDAVPEFHQLLIAGITGAKADPPKMDQDEFAEVVFIDLQKMMQLISAFMNQMSQNEESMGNAEPRGKARQIATKPKPGKK